MRKRRKERVSEEVKESRPAVSQAVALLPPFPPTAANRPVDVGLVDGAKGDLLDRVGVQAHGLAHGDKGDLGVVHTVVVVQVGGDGQALQAKKKEVNAEEEKVSQITFATGTQAGIPRCASSQRCRWERGTGAGPGCSRPTVVWRKG